MIGDRKSAGYPPEVLKKMLQVNYSEEASNYDQERYTDRPVDVRLSEMVRKLLPEWIVGNRVLELACGTGYWGEYLTSIGYQYGGIDISEGMVKECTRRGLDVIHEDVENTELQHITTASDTVFCIKAFGFFSNPVMVLNAIRHLLPLGGRFINFYYNDRYHNAVVRLYSLFHDPDVIAYQPPWDNRFTWKEYKWMCNAVGLKVVYIRDCVVLPFRIIPKSLRGIASKVDNGLTRNGFVTMAVAERR